MTTTPRRASALPLIPLLGLALLAAAGPACDGEKAPDAASEAKEPAEARKPLSKEESQIAEFQKILDADMAVPQEELARSKVAVRLSGTLVIPGYESGRIQIDAFRSATGPQKPATTARFEKPGAFTMLMPPDVGDVELIGLVDLQGDGPDQGDPRTAYDKNPITVGREAITGIELTIALGDIVKPPPDDQPAQPGEGRGADGANIDSDDGEILIGPDQGAPPPPAD